MTPQERELVDELFDRLAALEDAPRDADAERVIANGQRRAPNAVYALVQTVLVQEEALKAADARIQELEAALAPPDERPRGFLDSMRDQLWGREEQRGSVPSVRDGAMGVPPGFRGEAAMREPGGPPPGPGGYGMERPAPAEQGRGGSFLGTAAAAAAGVVGGALLLNTIRSAMGGQQDKGPFQGAFDQLSGRESASPWGGSAGGGDLARQAGLDDIGRGASNASGDGGESRSAGLFGSSQEGSEDQLDDGYDEDFDDGSDGDWDAGGDITDT